MSNKRTERGLVIERLPNLMFRIELEDKRVIRAYMGGKMKMNRISVLVGDEVEFEVDEQGSNNRIIRRIDK